INDIIDDAQSGSEFSLVLVSDTVDTVFDGVTDKEQAKIYVGALSCGWTNADCTSALSAAQAYFDDNRSAVMYLVTDKDYEVNDNLALINVSGEENNHAIYSYAPIADGMGIGYSGQVISYAADAELTVQMWITADVGGTPELIAETTVNAESGAPADFVLTSTVTESPAFVKLCIAENDALAEDNYVVVYDDDSVQNRKALMVSNITDENDDAAYLHRAIEHAGKADIDVVTPETYERLGATGYDLYVFNGYVPKSLPTQAAVWLIDAVDGSDTGSGVSYRGHTTPRDASGSGSYYTPQYNDGTSAVEKLLTKDIVGRNLAVRTYAQYVVPRNFTSILSIDGDDIVFAGLNGNGDREVVFSFRIKDSDLGLTDDFLILVRNLMDYSFPTELSQTEYVCGDVMAVNVVSGCEGIVVTSPSGNSNTLDTLDTDVCEVALREAGTYTLTVKMRGKGEKRLYAFAAVPQSESGGGEGGAMLIAGEREYNYSDGFYDDLLVFFILIAVIVLADWGVYCYEQYQLR
ncbi:MAG: hypothetical protein K2L88_03080, partial [Clostridiales bacterium]|nr:hypothetical protein [Clostridiales bacterium]